VHLVRHGETVGESSIRFHGANDVALSDVGRAQIEALLPLLAGHEVAELWHSPLSRAAESAQLLARGLGLDLQCATVEPAFREISFGRFEGFTAEEIEAADPEWFARWRAGQTEGFPGGELREAFRRRVREGWARVMAASTGAGDLLVVAHRGIVGEGLRWLLGAPEEPGDRFAVGLATVSTVRRSRGRWELERLGVAGPGSESL